MSENKSNKSDSGSLFVLVSGATGKQGGAVTRALLERGHRVRALTRNRESYKAKKLEKLGVELFEGDFGDTFTLQEASKGVDAFFAMTTPFEKGINFEIKSGFLQHYAAMTIGVEHFIFSSVASSDQKTGIPHFDSKYKIEQQIKSKRYPYTIIRPVYFMENFLAPRVLSELQKGKISMAIPSDRKLKMISLEDLANFVVYVIENRERFLNKTIEIASDEISGKRYVEILSHILGIQVKYQELNYNDVSAMGDDFIKTMRWLNEVGYKVDIKALHEKYPEIKWHTFETWATKQYWGVIEEPAKGKVI